MDTLPVEWAKKVDWNQGGAEQRPAGRPPKAPVNALEAYAQYLKSRVVKSALNHAPDGEEQPSTEFLQVKSAAAAVLHCLLSVRPTPRDVQLRDACQHYHSGHMTACSGPASRQ
jgi:hypothetical protein